MLIEFTILAMFCSYIHGSFHIQGSFHNQLIAFFTLLDIHSSFDIHCSVHNHAHSSRINTCQSIRPIILLCKLSLVRPSPLHIRPGKEITLIKHNVKNVFGHCLFGVGGAQRLLWFKKFKVGQYCEFFHLQVVSFKSYDAVLNLFLSSPLSQPCIWPSPH